MPELLTGILTYCTISIGICMFSWLIRNWRLNGNGFLRNTLRSSQKIEMPGAEDWAVPTSAETPDRHRKEVIERIRLSPFQATSKMREWLHQPDRG